MKVKLTVQCWVAAVLFLCSGDVSGQFTAAPPTCPGDIFNFSCTVGGDVNGFTTWRVGGTGSNIQCVLVHRYPSTVTCGPTNAQFKATPGTGFGTSSTSFSSTLSGTAISELDGTLVECFVLVNNADPGNRINGSALQILGPPSVSTLSCVDFSGDVSGAVNVTVSWTLSGGDNANFYLIGITTNAPQTPYEGLLNITNPNITQYELTGFIAGYEYNATVRGMTVSCGGLEGNKSDALTIIPQFPATPISEVCAVYDMVNGTLQTIESNWNEVENVTISVNCPSGQNIRASYELSYTTDSGTLTITCVVDGAECSNGRCHHELHNQTADNRCQPPVSDFNNVHDLTVSVTTRSIVGRSNPTVSSSIEGRNIDLEVHIDTTNLSNAFVECTLFQSGYNCTIEYGTDPSYTNLVNRDTSSTLGRTATIILSQELRGDTSYYYIVSAESSSQCVRVQGRFRVGCNEADLTDQSRTTNSARCADRTVTNSSSITDGVVCYNGATVGSTAVYMCNDGFLLIGNEARVCLRDGNWNGSIPQCIPGDQTGGIAGSVAGVVVEGALLFIAVFLGIVVYQKCKMMTPLHIAAKRGHKNSVENLVDSGTDVDITDREGRTPLHIAAREGHDSTVECLLDNKAEIDFKDKAGQSPLHIAAREGYSITVGLLADRKANINIQDKTGRTPLHAAAKGGHEDTVKCLVQRGANIGARDDNGMVPLHIAAEKGRYRIVGCLVECEEADINIQDDKNRTPLHIAAEAGHVNTVEHLLHHKPDVSIFNKNGRTPLQVANKRHHRKVARVLQKGYEGMSSEMEGV